MIEIILIFIQGWQSLDSNSGCPATTYYCIYPNEDESI